MTTVAYTRGVQHLLTNGAANVVLRALLVELDSTYVPDVDHDFLTDFTGGGGGELDDASAARKTLAGVAVVIEDASNRCVLDCDDITWAALTGGETVKGALVYIRVGADDTTPADDVLLWYDDDLEDKVAQGSDYALQTPNGLIRFTAA